MTQTDLKTLQESKELLEPIPAGEWALLTMRRKMDNSQLIEDVQEFLRTHPKTRHQHPSPELTELIVEFTGKHTAQQPAEAGHCKARCNPCKEKHQQLRQRLDEAEAVIRHYGNREHWSHAQLPEGDITVMDFFAKERNGFGYDKAQEYLANGESDD